MSESGREMVDAEEPQPTSQQGDAGPSASTPETEEAPDAQDERVKELTEKIDELQAKADEWLDKYRRSVAEFANYRKRQDRERQQQAWRVNAGVLGKLLEPLDDLDRALEHVPGEQADSPWVQGVTLISQKLRALLSEYNVEPIEALGQPFDPNYHAAFQQEPSDEYPEGTVMAELKKGYLMDGQLLRPALVKVSLGSQDAAENKEEPEG